MKRLLLALIFSSVSITAFAQQQDPPLVQVLSKRLNMEYSANIQCNTQLITIQNELASAQQEIKALKEKYEPKKTEEIKK